MLRPVGSLAGFATVVDEAALFALQRFLGTDPTLATKPVGGGAILAGDPLERGHLGGDPGEDGDPIRERDEARALDDGLGHIEVQVLDIEHVRVEARHVV